MNKFLRRLLFYIVGLGLGSAGVYFLWIKDRTDLPALWPQGIVKQNIGKSALIKDSLAICLLDCYRLDENTLKETVKEGKIRFGISEPRREPYPVYIIDGHIEAVGKVRLEIELADSLTHLRNIQPLPGTSAPDCTCP